MNRAVAAAPLLVTTLAACACSRRPPIASCDDDLGGVYSDGARRWMVLDRRASLEAYPLFPDGSGDGSADLVAGPRMIELARGAGSGARSGPGSGARSGPGSGPGSGARGGAGSGARSGAGSGAGSGERGEIEGTLRRWYMQRAERCDARVPVQVTRCAGDTLELVLADPAPPLGFAPCAWPGPGPSRVERWRRE